MTLVTNVDLINQMVLPINLKILMKITAINSKESFFVAKFNNLIYLNVMPYLLLLLWPLQHFLM